MRFKWFVLILLVSGLVRAQDFAVELSAMNLLYKGIDNPVRISVSGVSKENITIRTSSNIRLENGLIKVISGNQAYVQVGEIKGADTNWIGKQVFRIRGLPIPTARFGGLLNDGLPKPKASIAAQTCIIATMGSSFVYDIHYEVTHFKLIVYYIDKPTYIEETDGSTITATMRNAIRSTFNGDRVIIENINAVEKKYGLERHLSPIVMTIRGPKRLFDNVFGKLEYLSFTRNDLKNYLYQKEEIATFIDTTKIGDYNLVYSSDVGYHRLNIINSNGIKVTETLFDDENQVVYIKTQKDSNLSFIKAKNIEKRCSLTCSHQNNVNLVLNTDYTDWSKFYLPSQDFKPDLLRSYYTDTFINDLHRANVVYGINPVGECNTFYLNGNKKMEGTLMLLSIDSMKKNFVRHHSMSLNPLHAISIMHGTWLFYNPDDTLLETREYNMGVLME